DSMALLHFMHSLRSEWNLRLIALSVDHQLRGTESLEDLRYVESICNQWNIPFIGTSLDVPGYQQKKRLGTQVAAREKRYRFFAEQMRRLQADFLALGHHGDDQVETMLMNFVRTANPRAFSGIPVKRAFSGGYIIRPFLCVTKEDLMQYCNRHAITPRLDPSNMQTNYMRNDFRQNILPLFKEKNPHIHKNAQRLSEILQADEQYIEQGAERMVAEIVTFSKNPPQATCDIDRFQSYPIALQRRAYHLILNYLYDDLPNNLSYIHEEQFFSLMNNDKSNARIDFPNGLNVSKSYVKLLLSFHTSIRQMAPFHFTINIPDHLVLPNGWELNAHFTQYPDAEDRYTYVCDQSAVALPLHVRSRRSGDRMRLAGLGGHKKIKDIFIDAKIPPEKRDEWPLVVDDSGKILWLVGLRKGPYLRGEAGECYIRLRLNKGNETGGK